MAEASTFPNNEHATLEQFLDFYRATVLDALDDLSEDAAKATLLPGTDMTILGIVKHLAQVEDLWFQVRLQGAPQPEPWSSAPWRKDADWDFHSSRDDSIDEVIELYRAAIERSRTALTQVRSLDDTLAARRGDDEITVRWMLIHMIEETARHAGHLDILLDAARCAPS